MIASFGLRFTDEMARFLRFVFLLSCLIPICSALECYVCVNQDGNNDKCIKTVQTCDQFEDWCLSEVRWGSLPYWQQGAEKMYYISKRCAKKAECERTIREHMPRCDRIWYNDWECAECCQGDRCNYYITLGAANLHNHVAVTLLTCLVALCVWWRM